MASFSSRACMPPERFSAGHSSRTWPVSNVVYSYLSRTAAIKKRTWTSWFSLRFNEKIPHRRTRAIVVGLSSRPYRESSHHTCGQAQHLLSRTKPAQIAPGHERCQQLRQNCPSGLPARTQRWTLIPSTVYASGTMTTRARSASGSAMRCYRTGVPRWEDEPAVLSGAFIHRCDRVPSSPEAPIPRDGTERNSSAHIAIWVHNSSVKQTGGRRCD
jgi:hypothetical protein